MPCVNCRQGPIDQELPSRLHARQSIKSCMSNKRGSIVKVILARNFTLLDILGCADGFNFALLSNSAKPHWTACQR